jgi:hypothetical protein
MVSTGYSFARPMVPSSLVLERRRERPRSCTIALANSMARPRLGPCWTAERQVLHDATGGQRHLYGSVSWCISGLVDLNRVAVPRTASNFDRPGEQLGTRCAAAVQKELQISERPPLLSSRLARQAEGGLDPSSGAEVVVDHDHLNRGAAARSDMPRSPRDPGRATSLNEDARTDARDVRHVGT